MYNFQNEQDIMAEFDRISAEPIDNEPYSLVHNPKPVVESVLDFNGTKVDTGSWTTGDGVTEDKKKVGKAKTAKDPKLTKETPKTTKGEKKDDGKIVEKVDASEKKDDGKTTEVKTATEVKDGNTPKASTGEFDKAAKSAKTSQESGAKSNKKFAKGCDMQTRVKLFKEGVRSLAIDDKTKADAEKVLKEFDKFFKPKMEGVGDNLICRPGIDPAMDDVSGMTDDEINRLRYADNDTNQKLEKIGEIISLYNDSAIMGSDALSQIKSVIDFSQKMEGVESLNEGLLDTIKEKAGAVKDKVKGFFGKSDDGEKNEEALKEYTPKMEPVNSFEAYDESQVEISYGNGRTIVLDQGELTSSTRQRKLLKVTGSKTLEGLVGKTVVLEDDIEVGKPFAMRVNMDNNWRKWNSKAPITSIKSAM